MSTSTQLAPTTRHGAAPRPAVPQEVERLFHASLLLLIVTGFLALVSTGKLDALSVAFTSIALCVRVWAFFTGRELQIAERWTSYLGVVYIAVYALDFFFLSNEFVTATVHLVLFGMVVKLFSMVRERDYVYLATLSFVEVLAAAVLTVDTVFLIAFSVFLLTAIVTFICFEMRRSAAAAAKVAPTLRRSNNSERMEFAISRTAVAILAGIALFGSGIFFVLPRLSYGYLSKLAQQSTLSTGFSDNVMLGQIGRIQQSSEVAMHVKIDGDTTGTHELKMRGTVLTRFDGQRWSHSARNLELLQTAVSGSYNLDRDPPRADSRHQLVRYRVMMEPLGTNVLFLVSRPKIVLGRFRELAIDYDEGVQNLDNGRTASEYGGLSDLAEPTPADLRRTRDVVPPEFAERYLQLPEHLDPRISQLAHQIADRAPTPYEKALAIQQYLSTKYAYSLDLGSEKPADPLAHFLFERKSGHCEYFASSLAIMSRVVGVPTRLIGGFRGGEFNSVSGSYIIRARDAHSWVEVYVPGSGWVSMDPTPGAARFDMTSWRRMEMYLDAGREFWREWIINYDFQHQEQLAVGTVAKSRTSLDGTRFWFSSRYDRMMRWARRTNAEIERHPKQTGKQMVMVALAIMLLMNLRRFVSALRRLNIARNPRSSPQSAATIWYERMTRLAQRKGFRRAAQQTPMEFAATITDAQLRASVVGFTQHYERARFGDSADDAAKLPELFAAMRETK